MNQKKQNKLSKHKSKEKWLSSNGSPKWWIGMAAVGGLLVGAGSGFGVGVIASQSSNNQQFSQPVQTGQNQGSNQQQNSQNGHASQGNQQNGGPQDGGPSRRWSHKVVAKDKAAHKVADLVRCHRRQWWPKGMVPDNGMNQSGGQRREPGSSKSPTRRIQKIKTRRVIVKVTKKTRQTHRISLPQAG